MKRLIDVVAAFLGLIILAPLLVVVAVTIVLDSPGPVFFRQERVGLHGRPFRDLSPRLSKSPSAPR